jgi:hypothetical protein
LQHGPRNWGRHVSRASEYCHQKFEEDGAPAVPLAIQNEWGLESGARRGERMGNSVEPGHNVADAAVPLSSAIVGNRCKLGGPLMAFSSRSILVACARTAMVVVARCNLGSGPFTSNRINYVVELFTSQGCAYCPRADRWLAAIARAPDVVAVFLPVDYWDYIGWTLRRTAAQSGHRRRLGLPREPPEIGGRAPNFRRSAATMPFPCRAHGI